MNEGLIFFLGLTIYCFIAYLVLAILPKVTHKIHSYLKVTIHSFIYALIFGIGAAASGGDPGLAFPLPVIVAPFFTNPNLMIDTVLLPFLFWWIIIFLVMIISHLIKNRHIRKL